MQKNPERITAVIESFARHQNQQVVAKEIGISSQAISVILRKAGVDTRVAPRRRREPSRFQHSPEIVDAIITRYREIRSMPKVAKEFNITYGAVQWTLTKAGIKAFRPSKALYEERFWANVDKSGGFRACWPWTRKYKTKQGYGRMSYMGKPAYSHHLTWIFTRGELPKKRAECFA